MDEEFTKLITTCKNDPECTDLAVETIQKFQNALDKFQASLLTLRDKKPSLRELATVLLEAIDMKIEEAQEFFSPELLNSKEVQDLEQVLREPIDANLIPEQIYNRIINKYPFVSKNKWDFTCALVEEILPNFKDVIDTSLAALKNIQQQNTLEEWK
jgi:hypothetical protein